MSEVTKQFKEFYTAYCLNYGRHKLPENEIWELIDTIEGEDDSGIIAIADAFCMWKDAQSAMDLNKYMARLRTYLDSTPTSLTIITTASITVNGKTVPLPDVAGREVSNLINTLRWDLHARLQRAEAVAVEMETLA
jgi:hypothetical protein